MEIDVNKIIFLDTNCFIYYFEDNRKYADKLERIFVDIQQGKNKAYMSVLSLLNADYIVTNDIKFRSICEKEGIGIIDLENA